MNKIYFIKTWIIALGLIFASKSLIYGADNTDVDTAFKVIRTYITHAKKNPTQNENEHKNFILNLVIIQNICNDPSHPLNEATCGTINKIIEIQKKFSDVCETALYNIEYDKNQPLQKFADGYAQLRNNQLVPKANKLEIGQTIERNCSAFFRLGLHFERNHTSEWQQKNASVETAKEAMERIIDLKLILMPNKSLQQTKIDNTDQAKVVDLITNYLKVINNGLECEDKLSEVKTKVQNSYQNIHDFFTELIKNTDFFITTDQSTTIIKLFNDIITHKQISNLNLKQIEIPQANHRS